MQHKTLLPLLLSLALLFSHCQSKTSSEKTNTEGEEAQITDGHNAQNSLDWAGTYSGVLPCADCEGIATTITLNQDMSYHIQSQYLGKGGEQTFKDEGSFTWNKEGNTVVLSGVEGASGLYFVGENQLFHLDQEGNRITGPLAENYILKKTMSPNNTDILTSADWKLIELSGKPVERELENDKEIHITFDAKASRISGFAGCNGFSGLYTIEGEGDFENNITFSEVASTQMACPDLAIESELLKVLDATKSYKLNQKTLSLQNIEKDELARFEAVFK